MRQREREGMRRRGEPILMKIVGWRKEDRGRERDNIAESESNALQKER